MSQNYSAIPVPHSNLIPLLIFVQHIHVDLGGFGIEACHNAIDAALQLRLKLSEVTDYVLRVGFNVVTLDQQLPNCFGDLIELALALIRASVESFKNARPYRAEEVTRTLLCEGFFLGTPTFMDTFQAHSDQGIVVLLDYR